MISHSGEIVEIGQLLYFEQYICFSVETLTQLFAESESKLVSEVFLNKTSILKVNQLKTVLSIDSTKSEAALAKTSPFQQDKPEYQCKLLFQIWKKSTRSPTYGALRSLLDKCILWQKPTGELYCVDVSCSVGLCKNDITHTKDNLAICLSIYEMDHHFKKKESES